MGCCSRVVIGSRIFVVSTKSRLKSSNLFKKCWVGFFCAISLSPPRRQRGRGRLIEVVLLLEDADEPRRVRAGTCRNAAEGKWRNGRAPHRGDLQYIFAKEAPEEAAYGEGGFEGGRLLCAERLDRGYPARERHTHEPVPRCGDAQRAYGWVLGRRAPGPNIYTRRPGISRCPGGVCV